jgi:tetratricopeptide (TPR) repeat protein
MRYSKNNRILLAAAIAMAIGLLWVPDVIAQRGRGGGGGGGARGGGGGGGARMGGGGGARPSMGHVGGGGARPSMPSSRPSMPTGRPSGGSPNMSRPNASKPSFGNAMSRPSTPNLGGSASSRPSLGGSRPSLGGAGSFPNMPKPSSPSIANRPSLPAARPSTGIGGKPPGIGSGIATTRPGGGDRPSLGNANRPTTLPGIANRPGGGIGGIAGNKPTTLPGVAERPSLGGNRPGTGGDRPTTLPGGVNRPGIGANRPGIGGDRPTTLPGGVDRPGIGANRPGIGGDRPTTLPGGLDRPRIAGNRPGIGGDRPTTLPGQIGRPGIGGNRPGFGNNNNNNIVNRPNIGGNRPGLGNNNNINIGNDINIGNQVGGNRFPNRPNWDVDPGFSRPGWGLNGNNWNNNWHNNCINLRHNWYNGCWHGNWGSSWYAPVAWGAVGWGLNSVTRGWGMNNMGFFNPYFAEPMVAQSMPFDYSQPVVVNNYVSSDADAQGGESQASQSTPEQEQALTTFDQGLEKFKIGGYQEALSEFNTALKLLPGDVVVHEVRCLALFALGDYKAAAAGLNSLLSAAPGMDWTTMSGLYGNPDDYTVQLRKLEQFGTSNPNDPSSHFVLAYHYLVTGSTDAAIEALKVVVKNQPKDVTAKRMLDAMVPSETPDATAPVSAPASTTPAGTVPPETDLVGSWLAQSGDTQIELAITEDSRFEWKAGPKGKPPVVLKGELASASDGIELKTVEQGTIAGSVKSQGANNWNFSISGAPVSDPGLSFARLK